ncbi:MAG: hypothetical protein IKN92_05050 [Clostridia bacterium]|nr:hypothetical protein [Clostridia bacterium]
MKILEYIQNAKEYIYFTNQKNPLERALNSSEKELFLLIPNSLTIFRRDFVRLFSKYNLAELFDISNCFLGSWQEPYMFMHITKEQVPGIKIATYDRPAHPYRDDIYDPNCGKLRLCDNYLPDYLQYLNKLDTWRKTSEKPDDVKYEQTFHLIPPSEFNPEVVYTKYYLDYNTETRKVLKDEQIVLLSEVADVIPSCFDSTAERKEVRALDGNRMPRYPYIPELDTIKYLQTSVKLQKGDIVEHNDRFFLVDKEADFDVYAPAATNVIRAKGGFSPEYLYLFLTSKIAWRLRSVLTIPSGDHSRASSRRLNEFPIVVPKEDSSVYVDRFTKIAAPDEKVYQKFVVPDSKDTVSDILQAEIIESIRFNNESLLRSHVENDMKELNRCYEVKAYKSAIMLAGSMLETFLIDWISEIDGVNYFEEDKIVTKKDDSQGRADLVDYIYYLYDYYRPEWNDASKKAHSIRNKRNLVHPKLYLKRSEEITDELCSEIIDNLKEIIESRRNLS